MEESEDTKFIGKCLRLSTVGLLPSGFFMLSLFHVRINLTQADDFEFSTVVGCGLKETYTSMIHYCYNDGSLRLSSLLFWGEGDVALLATLEW